MKIPPVEAELFRAGGRTDRGADKRDETKGQLSPPILQKLLKKLLYFKNIFTLYSLQIKPHLKRIIAQHPYTIFYIDKDRAGS